MEDHVAVLLREKGISFTPSGKDYLIKCLNPKHEDNNPSCRVDRVSGVTHCFSCGFKANIFTYFGIISNRASTRIAKLKEKLSELKTSKGVEYPDNVVPFNKVYRGISAQTFQHFEAFYTSDEKLQDRVIFPIKDITGKVICFVGRHILSNGNPRYLNHPSGVKIPLFPPRLSERSNSLVLVEGIFDMLNLYDKGLKNAVCTFGTNTLQKDTKEKLLPFKAQGVEKIYIMFDPDIPGREAAEKLKPLLEQLEFIVEIIKLDEDNGDPGDLSEEYVHSIREYINV